MISKAQKKDRYNWVNNIPGGLCVFTLIDHYPYIEFAAWNKHMVEITEYGIEEINNKTFENLFCNKEYLHQSIKTLNEEMYICNGIKEKTFTIITKSKTERTISVSLSSGNDEDMQYFITALVKDVTIEKKKEEELKEIEERYKSILHNSTDAIFIYGDCKFIYANEKAIEMLEVEKIEDIIDQSIFDILHPDYYDIIKTRVIKSQEKRGILPLIEEKFITRSGKIIDVESETTCIPYKGLECNITFVRNITERKKMEASLKKSEKYFKKLFNNVNDAIYLNKVGDNGLPSVYIDVNDVGCKRLGYTREELRAMTPLQTNPTIDIARALSLVDQLTKKGNVIYEGVARTKDGKFSPVEINSIFLILNNERYILSISRDISERKKSEKILKEKEQSYRELIEALPYGVYIRTENKLLFANKVGLEYLGISTLDEIEGKSYDDKIKPHPIYRQTYYKNKEFITRNGYLPLTEEKYIRTKDNKVLDLEGMVIKHAYGENEDTYLIVTKDISDRKKAEALEKDMTEKSKQLEQVAQYESLRTEFFANISHELRTPVNVIFSALQLINFNTKELKEYTELYKYKKYIDIMKQNCYRLVRIINNLIDVTKIDSGYFNVELINTNIIDIVEDITLSVAEYISNKGISLIFDTEIEEKIIACDPDKIERIMLNLISNAVKFTEPGGSIFVTIKDMGKSIIISVKDTGIGISKNKQNSIFERFVQVDKSLARNNEGSGIGLSLVKSLVELHNGTIRVESELNKGSEFFIELPVELVEKHENNLSTNDYLLQGNVEKINIEFSDIYF